MNMHSLYTALDCDVAFVNIAIADVIVIAIVIAVAVVIVIAINVASTSVYTFMSTYRSKLVSHFDVDIYSGGDCFYIACMRTYADISGWLSLFGVSI